MSHQYMLLSVQQQDDADSLELDAVIPWISRLRPIMISAASFLLLWITVLLVMTSGRWNASTPNHLNYLHPSHNCTVAVRTEDACPIPAPDLEQVTEMHVAFAACGRGENVRHLLVTHSKKQ